MIDSLEAHFGVAVEDLSAGIGRGGPTRTMLLQRVDDFLELHLRQVELAGLVMPRPLSPGELRPLAPIRLGRHHARPLPRGYGVKASLLYAPSVIVPDPFALAGRAALQGYEEWSLDEDSPRRSVHEPDDDHFAFESLGRSGWIIGTIGALAELAPAYRDGLVHEVRLPRGLGFADCFAVSSDLVRRMPEGVLRHAPDGSIDSIEERRVAVASMVAEARLLIVADGTATSLHESRFAQALLRWLVDGTTMKHQLRPPRGRAAIDRALAPLRRSRRISTHEEPLGEAGRLARLVELELPGVDDLAVKHVVDVRDSDEFAGLRLDIADTLKRSDSASDVLEARAIFEDAMRVYAHSTGRLVQPLGERVGTRMLRWTIGGWMGHDVAGGWQGVLPGIVVDEAIQSLQNRPSKSTRARREHYVALGRVSK